MEKERLNYQAPTISQRKVVLQEVIAASTFTPDKAVNDISFGSSATTMLFVEGNNHAFESAEQQETFKTGWEEE